MPEIKSSIGGKSYQSAGMGMRQFEVEDASQYQENLRDRSVESRMASVNDLESQILESKKARSQGRERLNESAKRRIEMLCGVSRMTKELEIDGNIYALRTLKSKEIRDAVNASVKFDGSVDLSFETRKQFLARSLFQIAGTDINDFLNDDSFEAKLELLDNLEESIVSRLYAEYNKLSAESQEKYGIKNDTDVKGVIEDLKK